MYKSEGKRNKRREKMLMESTHSGRTANINDPVDATELQESFSRAEIKNG